MARFVSLNYRAGCLGLMAGGLVLMTGVATSLRADQPMAPTTPTTPTTQTQAKPAPVKTPATNAAPVLPPDTMTQYGKILAPSDQMAHPLKLKLPFPGVGEVKVPNQDELTMREKLEQLAKLSDADIRTQLEKWPAFSKMSLRDQGAMLQRIQDFRDYHSNLAKAKAHDMGLVTLSPDQQARFEKEYWDKRLEMDRILAKQFEPIFRAQQQKMFDELYRQFSAVAQVPKSPQPAGPPSTNKPAQTPPPVMPVKAAVSTAPLPSLGSAPQ